MSCVSDLNISFAPKDVSVSDHKVINAPHRPVDGSIRVISTEPFNKDMIYHYYKPITGVTFC